MVASSFELIAPAAEAFAITPSDTVTFEETRAIYVGTGGNIVCAMYDPVLKKLQQVTFNNVASGTTLSIRTKLVYVATTASQLVALR